MAASINASTSAGVVTTADTSGNLNLQSNGTTIIGYTSAGATVTGTLSASGQMTASAAASAILGSTKKWYAFNDGSNCYFSDTASGAGAGIAAGDGANLLITIGGNTKLGVSAGASSTSGIQLVAYTTNGTVTTTGGVGILSSASDATLKTHDGYVENPLGMLAGLRARYYYWNHELGQDEPAQRQLGFFAQDVNVALGDEAANPPKGDAKWGYYDRSVLAVAVEAINALRAEFNAYKEAHP